MFHLLLTMYDSQAAPVAKDGAALSVCDARPWYVLPAGVSTSPAVPAPPELWPAGRRLLNRDAISIEEARAILPLVDSELGSSPMNVDDPAEVGIRVELEALRSAVRQADGANSGDDSRFDGSTLHDLAARVVLESASEDARRVARMFLLIEAVQPESAHPDDARVLLFEILGDPDSTSTDRSRAAALFASTLGCDWVASDVEYELLLRYLGEHVTIGWLALAAADDPDRLRRWLDLAPTEQRWTDLRLAAHTSGRPPDGSGWRRR